MSSIEFWDELNKIFNAVVAYQEKSVEFNKRYITPWIRLGNVFDKQDRSREVVESYKKALEMDPTNAQVWHELGNAYFKLAEYDEAILSFQRAIELDPKMGWAYSSLAMVHMMRSDYDKAIMLYQKSIELLPQDREKAVSWNRLGNLYRKMNKYELALDAFQHADELDAEQHGLDDSLLSPPMGVEEIKLDSQADAPHGPVPAQMPVQDAVDEEEVVVGDDDLVQPDSIDIAEADEQVQVSLVLETESNDGEAGLEHDGMDTSEVNDNLSLDEVSPIADQSMDDEATLAVSETLTETILVAGTATLSTEAASVPQAESDPSLHESHPDQADDRMEDVQEEDFNAAAAELFVAENTSEDLDESAQSPALMPMDGLAQDEQPGLEILSNGLGVLVGEADQNADVELEMADAGTDVANFETYENDPLSTAENPDAEDAGIGDDMPVESGDMPAFQIHAAYEEYLRDEGDALLGGAAEELQPEGAVDVQPDSDPAADPVTVIDSSGEVQMEVDINNAKVWNELGNVYYNNGAIDDAIAAYNKAIELDRSFAWPYSNLALAYTHKDRLAEAVLLYQRSIELFGDEQDKAVAWNRLGNVYRRMDNYEQAISSYQCADQLDPNNITFSVQSRYSLLGTLTPAQPSVYPNG